MKRIFYLLFVTVILIAGCKQKVQEPEMKENTFDVREENEQTVHADPEVLEIKLINEDHVGVGIATLSEVADGVKIDLDAHHLQPGEHGFHIHERGLCDAPTFESAGGHFNPTNKNHGFDDPEGPHAGDMENIEVADDGTVKMTVINEAVTLKKQKANSLFSKEGTSLMIHADPDDYISQPAGNAGKRIVCGVIAAPEKEEN